VLFCLVSLAQQLLGDCVDCLSIEHICGSCGLVCREVFFLVVFCLDLDCVLFLAISEYFLCSFVLSITTQIVWAGCRKNIQIFNQILMSKVLVILGIAVYNVIGHLK